MWILLAVVLVLGLTAGCVSPPPSAPAAVDSIDLLPPELVIPLRNAQSESFIEVSSDGRVLLTCLHGEFKEPSLMYASTDAGGSWRELKAVPTPVTGGDCEVALTSDGGWHFIHTQAAGVTIASTFDEGTTWRVDRTAGPPVASFSDRPWLEATGATLVLSYSGYLGITARVSQDSGATWGLPSIVVQSPPGRLSLSGHLSIGADGRTVIQPYAHVPVQHAESEAGTVALGMAVSTDLGGTWQDRPLPAALQALPVHPAASVGPGGDLHLTAYVTNATGFDFVLWTSTDAGATWTDGRVLLASLANPGRAWAAARPDGLLDLLVQARGTSLGSIEEESVVALVRVDPFGSAVQVRVVDLAREEFVSMAHDASGNAHIVYTRGGGDVLGGPSADSNLWLVRERPAGSAA